MSSIDSMDSQSHLTVSELIEFVSADIADTSAQRMLVSVNTHIRSCPQCLERVRAFQVLHDELLRLGRKRKRLVFLSEPIDGTDL